MTTETIENEVNVKKSQAKIGTAWVGRQLSWLEILMLESFVLTGHEVTLFSDVPDSVPQIDGVTVMNMREVFDYEDNEREYMPAASFTDIFRLNMIAKTDLTWIDTDVVSMGKLELWNGYLLVRSTTVDNDHICNGFLRLPHESQSLAQIIGEIDTKDLDYSWMRYNIRKKILNLPREDRFIEASRISRQVYGPNYVTSRILANDEFSFVRPKEALDPVPWDLTDLFFDSKGGCYSWFTDETVGVHLALSQIRKRHINKGPRLGSFLYEMQEKVKNCQ